MKFYCLGYYDEKKWNRLSEKERNGFIDECFAYDDELRKSGRIAGGDGLQGSREAKTIRWKNGKPIVSEGPYADTREQLGGILVLEAGSMEEAVRIISNHPGLKGGPFEIRQAEDMSGMMAESERRRSKERKSA